MRRLIVLCSCFLLLSLVGCRRVVVPPDVMSEEQMAQFLEEAYMLEGFYAIETHFHFDTLHPQMVASYDSLLAQHHITRNDFQRSVSWYCRHPDLYQRIHDTVLARIDRQLEE